jgi:AICAR transformylase/IMP cyclohydrolase PurH
MEKNCRYNNLLDVDAAVNLIAENDGPTLPFKTQQRLRFGYQNFN